MLTVHLPDSQVSNRVRSSIRKDSSAKTLINRADPDEKYSTIVFVEDRKLIKAV